MEDEGNLGAGAVSVLGRLLLSGLSRAVWWGSTRSASQSDNLTETRVPCHRAPQGLCCGDRAFPGVVALSRGVRQTH